MRAVGYSSDPRVPRIRGYIPGCVSRVSCYLRLRRGRESRPPSVGLLSRSEALTVMVVSPEIWTVNVSLTTLTPTTSELYPRSGSGTRRLYLSPYGWLHLYVFASIFGTHGP